MSTFSELVPCKEHGEVFVPDVPRVIVLLIGSKAFDLLGSSTT